METIQSSMSQRLKLYFIRTDSWFNFVLSYCASLAIPLNVCCFLVFVIGQLEPITLYDQGGVHVSLHFARDSPPGHPGVAVVVISTVNTSALDVKDFLFQAAVPKVTNSTHNGLLFF